MQTKPANIIIVDNENSPATKQMCDGLQKDMQNSNAECQIHYLPQTENLGGAGGFSKGTEHAYNIGCEWLWLMDDDVAVYCDAIDNITPWLKDAVKDDHRVLQVQRMNFDNTPFYWQYHFLVKLGIPNPIAPSGWGENEKSRAMNTACFEGGIFHRDIVRQNGLPDPRFFIYSDDTIYGYLASKITKPLLINITALRRTRTLEHLKIGKTRKLNSTSDMTRYYIMRNRGLIAHYLRKHNDYNALIFNFGTLLTFIKEFIRLFITKSIISGLPRLLKGMHDGRKVRRDHSFEVMPPLN